MNEENNVIDISEVLIKTGNVKQTDDNIMFSKDVDGMMGGKDKVWHDCTPCPRIEVTKAAKTIGLSVLSKEAPLICFLSKDDAIELGEALLQSANEIC